jgi:plasmid stabilization system protein ParE
MQIKWSKSAKSSLRQIQSIHFSKEETQQYKVHLVREIEQKISVLMEIVPSNEPSWKGTYRLFSDKFKVYYSFSADKRICFIEALQHQHQNLK